MTIEQQTQQAAFSYAEEAPDSDELYDAFVVGAEWERHRDKWISVKDQLPPPEDANSNAKTSAFVLVWDWKYGMHKGFFLHGHGYWNDKSDTITHWQPLPKEPLNK